MKVVYGGKKMLIISVKLTENCNKGRDIQPNWKRWQKTGRSTVCFNGAQKKIKIASCPGILSSTPVLKWLTLPGTNCVCWSILGQSTWLAKKKTTVSSVIKSNKVIRKHFLQLIQQRNDLSHIWFTRKVIYYKYEFADKKPIFHD